MIASLPCIIALAPSILLPFMQSSPQSVPSKDTVRDILGTLASLRESCTFILEYRDVHLPVDNAGVRDESFSILLKRHLESGAMSDFTLLRRFLLEFIAKSKEASYRKAAITYTPEIQVELQIPYTIGTPGTLVYGDKVLLYDLTNKQVRVHPSQRYAIYDIPHIFQPLQLEPHMLRWWHEFYWEKLDHQENERTSVVSYRISVDKSSNGWYVLKVQAEPPHLPIECSYYPRGELRFLTKFSYGRVGPSADEIWLQSAIHCVFSKGNPEVIEIYDISSRRRDLSPEDTTLPVFGSVPLVNVATTFKSGGDPAAIQRLVREIPLNTAGAASAEGLSRQEHAVGTLVTWYTRIPFSWAVTGVLLGIVFGGWIGYNKWGRYRRAGFISLRVVIVSVLMIIACSIAILREHGLPMENAVTRIESAVAGHHDFGTVIGTKTITHVYSVHNASQTDWKLQRSRSSCGCLSIESVSQVVPPGDTLKVVAVLNTLGSFGRQDREIVLGFEPGPSEMRFTATALLIPEVEADPGMIMTRYQETSPTFRVKTRVKVLEQNQGVFLTVGSREDGIENVAIGKPRKLEGLLVYPIEITCKPQPASGEFVSSLSVIAKGLEQDQSARILIVATRENRIVISPIRLLLDAKGGTGRVRILKSDVPLDSLTVSMTPPSAGTVTTLGRGEFEVSLDLNETRPYPVWLVFSDKSGVRFRTEVFSINHMN